MGSGKIAESFEDAVRPSFCRLLVKGEGLPINLHFHFQICIVDLGLCNILFGLSFEYEVAEGLLRLGFR